VPPKSRAEFLNKFHQYLDRPELHEQRLRDDPGSEFPNTYYHWIHAGIDFIYLDNATQEQFDSGQMKWLEGVIDRDGRNASIHTLVVGMHKALPDSISLTHSMNESGTGIVSGRRVYRMLLEIEQHAHKRVYLLASHSHYFMEGIFNTPYWNSHGGVLPGWIIGTAGAERNPLPPGASLARRAKTNVYGYLLATVNPAGDSPGSIDFRFEELARSRLPSHVVERFTARLVDECFDGNRRELF
ncbi:MAG: hypothetical protein JO356_21595, partial [Acidobacteria bacterium]|nr:hypothetical protein [Acidobacteriota bacterium]